MQFLIKAYDYKDENAIERRLASRENHMKNIEEMFKEKKILYAVAILDEKEKMIGSVIIADFPSRESLDEWLKVEPYVVNNVWEKIEVNQCKVGPIFMDSY